MKRQDMIDTMRSMGWRPVGCPYTNKWVGVSRDKASIALYRMRQDNPYREDNIYGGADDNGILVYPWSMKEMFGKWSNLCDDEVLRFYLKIMMEGL